MILLRAATSSRAGGAFAAATRGLLTSTPSAASVSTTPPNVGRPSLDAGNSIEAEMAIRKRLHDLVPQYKEFGTNVVARQREQRQADQESAAQALTVNKLMAAGLHLGHRASKLNITNKSNVFGKRNGIHIINLEQTIAYLRRAANLLREIAMEGGTIVFVGTHDPKIGRIAVNAARSCNSYYVCRKWIYGSIFNSHIVLRRYNGADYSNKPIPYDPEKMTPYRIYGDDDLKRPNWVELLKKARQDWAAMKKAEGVDVEPIRKELEKKLFAKKAAAIRSLQESNEVAHDPYCFHGMAIDQYAVPEDELEYLLKTLPEPPMSDNDRAAIMQKSGGNLEEAQRLLKIDAIVNPVYEFPDMPDHVHYRLKTGQPIDPAADPTYDVEEDLYLTKEQILEKKRRFIQAKEQEVSYEQKVLPPHKPDILVVLNVQPNRRCLSEATTCGVPTIGVVDTNADASSVTFPIPANDDSIRGLSLIAHVLSEAVREGHEMAAELRKIGEASRAKVVAKRQAMQRKRDQLDA